MGFWTIGPVAGSLVVSVVVTHTIEHLTAWQDQYIIAGVVGLVVFVIALLWLRELAPGLRDQIMVNERDLALVEARAKGIDVETAVRKPFRQMLHFDIVGSSIAISLLLFIYYAAVGFFPVFFQTTFAFSTSTANSLGNWMWGVQTVALIGVGVLSDKLRVRKPFMLVGALGAIASTIALISRTTHPETSYTTFAIILVCLAFSLGLSFAPWMASFTETIERRNPALAATGLSLWGLILRIVVTIATFILPFVVHSVTTLVKDGPTVQAAVAGQDPSLNATQNAIVKAVAADSSIVDKVMALAAKYDKELATAAKLTPATQDALGETPDDLTVQAQAVSEISGKPKALALRVITLGTKYASEIDAANAIDSTTQVAVLGNPNDQQASATAVAEIAAGLKIAPAQAQTRLDALKRVPVADLLFLDANADPIEKAGAQLTALGAVPAADLDYLNKYGTPLQDPKSQAALKYLEAHGPKVQAAAESAPREWQNYFWIGVGGEIVFIPFLFLMAGYWRPKRAKQAEIEHNAMVDAELAKLGLPRRTPA
jgi:ACS family D-galactonate transporter-like MFS transporter